jgi:hypothetical protein
MGGSEITGISKDEAGNRVITFGGAVLANATDDGYITGSSASVEMLVTRDGCEVESVNISTGASFHEMLSKEATN